MAQTTNPFGWALGRLQGLWRRYGGSGWGRTRLLLPGSRFDYEREAGYAWANSIVGLGINWLADRFPEPPLRACKVGRRGELVPLPRHPAVARWERPNAYYGRRTLESAVGLSLVCDGNAWVYKQRSRSGEVAGLWWVWHDRVAPAWDDSDATSYLEGWTVQLDVGRYFVPKEDMIHFRVGIDPLNDRLGLAPLKSQLREVCTDNESGTYTAALLRNGGVPGLMIVPADDKLRPTPQDAERIKERLEDSIGGESRGSAVVLAGNYRVEQVGFSPEQLTLKDLPRRSQSRIASALGVAAMSLGLDDANKTYANLAEANRASWGKIRSTQSIVAEALRWGLVPEYDDPESLVLEYDYTGISELNEDLKSKHDRVREDYKAGLLTQAAAQDLLGYDPDPDGDRYFPGTTEPPPSLDEAPLPPPVPMTVPTPGGAPAPEFGASANGKHWRY